MIKVTVPVTQKDREAAAPFTWGAFGTHVVDGECDDLPCPQAFAAHRIAADLTGYERGQRETVERIVAWLRDQVEYGDPFGIHEDLADAIEAGEWK